MAKLDFESLLIESLVEAKVRRYENCIGTKYSMAKHHCSLQILRTNDERASLTNSTTSLRAISSRNITRKYQDDSVPLSINTSEIDKQYSKFIQAASLKKRQTPTNKNIPLLASSIMTATTATSPSDGVTDSSSKTHENSLIKKDNTTEMKRRSFHVPESVLEFFLDDSTVSTTFSTDESDRDDDEHEDHASPPSPLSSPLSTPMSESRDTPSTGRKHEVAETPIPRPHQSPVKHRHSSSDPLIHSCLHWMSSGDIDMNRLGLQRLMLLLKGRAIHQHQTRSQASLSANVLIYGGNYKFSMEDRLRYAFATLICDAPHEDVGMRRRSSNGGARPIIQRRSSVVSRIDLEAMMSSQDSNSLDREDGSNSSDGDSATSNLSDWDEDEMVGHEGPQGKESGILHLQALKVLAAALEHLKHRHEAEQQDNADDNSLSEDDSDDSTIDHSNTSKLPQRPIPLNDTIWRNTMHSLVHNIETNHTPDITGYSLRILRLLQSINPCAVTPLVQQTLFPQLIYLQEYGKVHLFPMIRIEASRLLEGTKRCQKRYSWLGVEL